MSKTLLATAAALLISTFAGVSPALAWDKIGERIVTDRLDVDVIHLPGNRKFSRVKVCVKGNPVHFYDFDIFFRNGGHQDVNVRSRINAGECTRDRKSVV